MSSNNENMRRRKSEGRILHKMKDSRNHRPSFAGLSRGDGENRMNGTVNEAFSNFFAEINLIGEEGVGNRGINGKLIEFAEGGLADDNLRKKA